MAPINSRRRPRTRREVIQKPSGSFHHRVQQVGPEHFGIVCFDCHKARSKWMLCDFFGNVLLAPAEVEHQRPALDQAIAQLRQACTAHQLNDLLVAIERTGNYHRVVRDAYVAAGFETRIVHPFATKQFRQPADPGNKTDDADLAALHRAAVNGFALIEATLDENWTTLQLLVRHRRDLVGKTTILSCQIREHLEAAFPGLAAGFEELWESACVWHLLRHFDSPQALQAAGVEALGHSLRAARIPFQRRTLAKVLAWAAQAVTPQLAAVEHRRVLLALYDDRTRKTLEIQALERELAARLTATPYVLLLSFPGVNVVSAAEFAGEMGPISHYANSRAITGRAGLRPSRYQSDRVDHADGPLVQRCNHKLRAAIMMIADNLVGCNRHFNALFHRWKIAGKDPRHSRVKVGQRFCRIAYHMVAGRQVFRHPCLQGRHYILDKLSAFHRDHHTPVPALLRDLESAIAQLPREEYAAEAQPLHEELQRIQSGRRRGPQLLGDILPIVLARLGVAGLQSPESGDSDPH
jgi:transposase